MVSSSPAFSPPPPPPLLPPSPVVRWHLGMRSVKSSPFLLLLASPNRMSGLSTFWFHSSRLRSTARGTPDPSTSACTSIGAQASKSLRPRSAANSPQRIGRGDGSGARKETRGKRLLPHTVGELCNGSTRDLGQSDERILFSPAATEFPAQENGESLGQGRRISMRLLLLLA